MVSFFLLGNNCSEDFNKKTSDLQRTEHVEAETVDIAKRRIGVVKQGHSPYLLDFNSAPQSQPTARLGCTVKDYSNLLWVSKGEKVILASGF